MKDVYLFDPNTRVYRGFISAGKRNVDSIGLALKIPSSTEIPVISNRKGYQRYFKDETWDYIIDNRNKEYWDADGTKHTITEIGEDLPEGALLEAPVIRPTDAELAATARAKRDALLNGIAWRYERNAREARLGIETTDNIEVLDAYSQALADVPQQTNFPTDIEWPPMP